MYRVPTLDEAFGRLTGVRDSGQVTADILAAPRARMKRLFDAAGVDYVQWRALMRAYTLTDFATLLGAYGSSEALRAVVILTLTGALLTLAGGGSAVVILLARDPLLAGIVMVTATMWMVGMLLLFQTPSLILPEDYAIVGFRPVTSRTYLAVRIGALLSQVLEIAVLTGLLPVAALLALPGGLRTAPAAALAILMSGLAATFAMVALVCWLQQVFRPALLQRAVAVTQTVALLGFTGLYLIVGARYLNGGLQALRSALSLEVPRTAWFLAFPGTWFGAYMEIARGRAGPFELAAAGLSLAAIVALATLMKGRLSVDYAIRVAGLTTDAADAAAREPRLRSFLTGERRAMLMLIAGQLRGDLTVQTGLAITVITSVALIGGMLWLGDLPGDPFAGQAVDPSQLAMIYLPLTVRSMLMNSMEWEASWVVSGSPAERVKLLAAVGEALIACLVVPALLFFTGLYLYSFGNAGHALAHAAISGLVAFVVLQLSMLIDPTLPFTRPIGRGDRGFLIGLMNIPLVIAGMAISMAFRLGFYKSPATLVVGVAGLGVTSAILSRLTRRRLSAT